MISLVLVPLIVIITLIGGSVLISSVFVKQKALMKRLLRTGGIILVTPWVLIALGFLLTAQNHKEYAGQYSGVTDEGHVVKLLLKDDKNFVMQIEECDSIVAGTWDNVLHDDYILELYLPQNKYGIQAILTKSEISFFNSLDLGCLRNEKLELKKEANDD